MKPFNPRPNEQKRQWIRGSSNSAFHLRDTSVRLPLIRVACGSRVDADKFGLYEFCGEHEPASACQKCLIESAAYVGVTAGGVQ